jgi:hypothetical protein
MIRPQAQLGSFSSDARQAIQAVDQLTQLPPDAGQPSVNQFQVLDAYVGLAFSNWQVAFGRQSLWWGPGDGGPLILGDNAGPHNMFRINRVTPFKLPSVLGWLGPLRQVCVVASTSILRKPNGVPIAWCIEGTKRPAGGA